MALSVSTLTDVDADPVIDNGRVFALGQGGRMASYELVTGQRSWEISIAGISTPYVVGEWVYAMTDDGKLLCVRSEEHTSELQSLMRISYAVFCLKKKTYRQIRKPRRDYIYKQ